MKKAILMYNPLSGSQVVPMALDSIIERFQEKDIIIQPYRIGTGLPELLLTTLKQGHYDFAVISGGDGTLNTAVNVLMKLNLDIPVGFIPSGTCNDFARCLGLPLPLHDSIDVILEGKTTGVDVGLIDEKQYFLSTCAGGLFVDVSFNTNNELKRNFGPLAYYLKALTEVVNIRPFSLKITTKDQVVEEEAILLLILNGKHVGGFYNVIKDADIQDGMMNIVMVKNCSHIDLAGLFFKVISREALPDTHVVKIKADECMLECQRHIQFSVDGEEGKGIPKKIRFIHRGLNVFVP